MKAAREVLSLSRKGFCEKYGGRIRTLEKNEAGSNEAGVCLAGAFIRAGINANWLLTGEGPMLLKDLELVPAKVVINADALGITLDAVRTAHPKASFSGIAKLAAKLYVMSVEEGVITDDDIVPPAQDSAA